MIVAAITTKTVIIMIIIIKIIISVMKSQTLCKHNNTEWEKNNSHFSVILANGINTV